MYIQEQVVQYCALSGLVMAQCYPMQAFQVQVYQLVL